MTLHSPLPPFAATSGPRNARVVILGEAWGTTESLLRRPFAGESGKLLWQMLGEAWPEVEPELHAKAARLFRVGDAWSGSARNDWLHAAGVLMTNVFAFRPQDSSLDSICCKKAELGKGYALRALSLGKYVRPEFLGELDRLSTELREVRPNLVIALGNTAAWAVLGSSSIGAIRGTTTETGAESPFGKLKVLPTYHPAGVMRNWSWRTIVVADLIKALRESASPSLARPQRFINILPASPAEAESWTETILAASPPLLSCDIETGGGQIKCVGFGTSRNEAWVFPFTDPASPTGSYWPDRLAEERVWLCVARLLASSIPKLFQNGMYDLQYLSRMGFRVEGASHDTMLLHHSIFPEMQKGLGFMGSIYTSEPAWKLMNKHKATEVTKGDD